MNLQKTNKYQKALDPVKAMYDDLEQMIQFLMANNMDPVTISVFSNVLSAYSILKDVSYEYHIATNAPKN